MSEEAAIQRVLENVAATFGALDLSGWLGNFHSPCMIAATCVDPANPGAMPAQLMEAMRQRGLTRSQLDSCAVQLLTPASAIASAVFTRFAGESVLERLGATYVLQKRDDRWQVLLVTGHSPDVAAIKR